MIEVEVTVEDLDNTCCHQANIDAKYGPDSDESICTTCILAEALKRTGIVPKPYVSSLPWKVCSEQWNSHPMYSIKDAWLMANFDMARDDDELFESLRASLPVTVVLTDY